MTKNWSWRKAFGRIVGNGLTSFFSPLAGGGITFVFAVEDDNLRVLYTALVTSIIITGMAIGKMFDEWSRKKCP